MHNHRRNSIELVLLCSFGNGEAWSPLSAMFVTMSQWQPSIFFLRVWCSSRLQASPLQSSPWKYCSAQPPHSRQNLSPTAIKGLDSVLWQGVYMPLLSQPLLYVARNITVTQLGCTEPKCRIKKKHHSFPAYHDHHTRFRLHRLNWLTPFWQRTT